MFIDLPFDLGLYLGHLYYYAKSAGCKLNIKSVDKIKPRWARGIREGMSNIIKFLNNFPDIALRFFTLQDKFTNIKPLFDSNYLFSDAVSLYFKGINIFPDIFGDEWHKYVPVESLKEIQRQVTKTLNN